MYRACFLKDPRRLVDIRLDEGVALTSMRLLIIRTAAKSSLVAVLLLY